MAVAGETPVVAAISSARACRSASIGVSCPEPVEGSVVGCFVFIGNLLIVIIAVERQHKKPDAASQWHPVHVGATVVRTAMVISS
jgi:hypothetical protein